MRVFVFVNQVQEIGARQTTALLIAALVRAGHDVFLANVDSLATDSRPSNKAQLLVTAANVTLNQSAKGSAIDAQAIANFSRQCSAAKIESLTIDAGDLILIRTNPGRDLERHQQRRVFLELCQIAVEQGVQVINDPARLSFFASKAAIALLPEPYRPAMLIASDVERAVEFIHSAPRDCVVKPLLGSRGNDVIRVGQLEKNLRQQLRKFLGQAFVVQHFVESSQPGDQRVVVVDGDIVQHQGYLAGIHRCPAPGDFRANLHAGGTAQPLRLTESQREAVLAAASLLGQSGIRIAGIDLIESQVIEFNVFSTGGLYDANRFAEFDFADEIVARLVR